MNFSLKNLAFVAIAATAVTLTSCGDDDVMEDMTPNRAPTISLQSANGGDFNTNQTDLEVIANNNIDVTVNATDADGNLNVISFLRNGILVTPTTGFVRSVDASGNATALASSRVLITDNSSFIRTFRFAVPADFAQTAVYSVIVEDSGSPILSDTSTFTFSTLAQPIDRDSASVTRASFFFNRLGMGFGSLDLVTGDSIRSDDTTATSRLQDAGNGTGTGTSWAQVLIGEGDVQIYKFTSGVPSGFNYDDVTFEDQFNDIFQGGSTFDVTDEQNRTRRLETGDIFFARSADRFYIVRVVEINPNEGPGNNKGRWTLEYKSAPRS